MDGRQNGDVTVGREVSPKGSVILLAEFSERKRFNLFYAKSIFEMILEQDKAEDDFRVQKFALLDEFMTIERCG